MAIQLFTGTVCRVQDLTHDVREIDLYLRDPAEIEFKAGQFISFEIRPPGARPVVRPYSIVSPPQQSKIVTLLFNLVPGGPGSNYLFSLKEGEEVRFKGVAGSFYLRDDFSRDVLFVATGTGIAPIRSMLLDLFIASLPDPPRSSGDCEANATSITRRSLKRWQSTIRTSHSLRRYRARRIGGQGMREGSPAWSRNGFLRLQISPSTCVGTAV